MANRSTFKSNVTGKIQPLMTTPIHRDVLNNDLADNIVFIDDVAVVQNSGSTNITVDFTNKDRIDLTRTGGALNITVAGMTDGNVKFLLITKTAGQEITFVSVSDVTPIKANVTALSTVLFRITRKSSFYFAEAIAENVKTATESIEGVLEIATAAESQALTIVNKIVTPGTIPKSSGTQQGVIRIGTTTEANALSSTSVALTPGTTPQASEIQKGVIEVATAAENDAGTAGNLAVIASELKRKYDALVALITGTSAITFDTSGAGFGITVSNINGTRTGKLQVVTGKIVVDPGTPPVSVESKIAQIDAYDSPGYEIFFAYANTTNVNEGASGRVDTLGNIYIKAYKESTWVFNISILGA